MTQKDKRFRFWLICMLLLVGAPLIGGLSGSLFTRIMKGARMWKGLPPPPGEKVVAILDATITTDKEHRLCVKTERGAVYIWQKSYQGWGRLNPDGPMSGQCWHILKPLPGGEAIKYLIVSYFDFDRGQPLVAVKSENGQTYAWQDDNWHPFEKITTALGLDWPPAWPSDGESKPRRGFRSWFTLPKPPGKVVDETKVSFEGALSWWVSSYVLLEDGRLFVLAAEADFIDVVFEFGGAAIGLLAGIIVLISIGIRRKRANAIRSEPVTA